MRDPSGSSGWMSEIREPWSPWMMTIASCWSDGGIAVISCSSFFCTQLACSKYRAYRVARLSGSIDHTKRRVAVDALQPLRRLPQLAVPVVDVGVVRHHQVRHDEVAALSPGQVAGDRVHNRHALQRPNPVSLPVPRRQRDGRRDLPARAFVEVAGHHIEIRLVQIHTGDHSRLLRGRQGERREWPGRCVRIRLATGR